MRDNDVCSSVCGNTGCSFNELTTRVPEKNRFLVFMKGSRYCGGWVKPKTQKKTAAGKGRKK